MIDRVALTPLPGGVINKKIIPNMRLKPIFSPTLNTYGLQSCPAPTQSGSCVFTPFDPGVLMVGDQFCPAPTQLGAALYTPGGGYATKIIDLPSISEPMYFYLTNYESAFYDYNPVSPRYRNWELITPSETHISNDLTLDIPLAALPVKNLAVNYNVGHYSSRYFLTTQCMSTADSDTNSIPAAGVTSSWVYTPQGVNIVVGADNKSLRMSFDVENTPLFSEPCDTHSFEESGEWVVSGDDITSQVITVSVKCSANSVSFPSGIRGKDRSVYNKSTVTYRRAHDKFFHIVSYPAGPDYVYTITYDGTHNPFFATTYKTPEVAIVDSALTGIHSYSGTPIKSVVRSGNDIQVTFDGSYAPGEYTGGILRAIWKNPSFTWSSSNFYRFHVTIT